ncbi:MAG: hypothetical protein DHS20C18_05570 [Saprospiraceae bacterium]|nr:MAG: hypothetical protein DHS20C18_05570 [Saprospiraceae bacterium]
MLRKALAQELRLQLILAWLLVFSGMMMVFYGLQWSVMLVVFGLVIVLLATRLVLQLVRYWNVDHHPIMQALFYQPQEIVWVYALITERVPFGIQFIRNGVLYLKLKNGDELSVSFPAKKLKLVSKALNRLLPHASFGFTVEREQTFITDPEQLMRRKDSEEG